MALACSTWTCAGWAVPMGKNSSGSSCKQAASLRHFTRIGLLIASRSSNSTSFGSVQLAHCSVSRCSFGVMHESTPGIGRASTLSSWTPGQRGAVVRITTDCRELPVHLSVGEHKHEQLLTALKAFIKVTSRPMRAQAAAPSLSWNGCGSMSSLLLPGVGRFGLVLAWPEG